MNLHIHIWTNLEYFELLNTGMLFSGGKKDREIAQFFMENFPWELANNVSPQYEVHFQALKEIKQKLWNNAFDKISGVYYWSDNCEYLIPYKSEIEKAIWYFIEFNKKFPPHTIRSFSLVTPYVWNTMLEKLEETLAYLNELNIRNPIEVVVNDFWVLRLLQKKYSKLHIIFGRLIHKLLKTPLIDTYWYNVHPSGESIKNKTEGEKELLRQEIVKWQLKFYNSSEAEWDLYQNFLQKHWVERIALDYMEKREDLYKKWQGQEIWMDLYYPWALIFTGRLCDTSAIENPSRWFYAIDDICPRTCNRYDIHYKVQTVGYHMIQRGNAWYRSEIHLDFLSDECIKHQNNRLIFAPFISV